MTVAGWLARALALAGTVLMLSAAGGKAVAQQFVGDWVVRLEPDRFGDGATDVAVTVSQGVGFAVRCIRKRWSLAVMDLSADPKPLKIGSTFALKFRVDGNPVVIGMGAAIHERLIQVETETNIVGQVLAGKELALRLRRPNDAAADYVFSLRGAKRALTQHLKDCPAPG